MAAEPPILHVEALQKRYGAVTALQGLDLRLDRPGVYGFLGPNGAGKTTAFKTVAGLLRPTSGRVRIGGADVHVEPREALRHLGVQFDAPAFYPYLSGRDNLQVIAHWLGRRLEMRIDALLERVGLGGAADRRVQEYSWGMKQRLGLAATLLSDPQLLLLDEPTNGLDPAGIADIRRLLPRMAHEEGRTILLASHRMGEVEQVCDHVTIIHHGAVVAAGEPAVLIAGEGAIEIRTPDAARAAELVRSAAPEATIERLSGDRLGVRGAAMTPAALNRRLLEGGVEVEEIVRRGESLEDLFFRLTGGRSRG